MAYETTPFSIDEHRDAIAALWRDNLSDSRIGDVVPARLRWFYEKNPLGQASTVLGLHAESQQVIGCGSYFPRNTLVSGRIVKAGVLSDFAVARDHRVAGAAVKIQRALAKGSHPTGYEFLYGYPNEQSLPIFKRVGHKVIGETTAWVKPLRSEYKVRERIPNPALAKAAAAVIDRGLSVVDLARAIRMGRTGVSPKQFRIEVTTAADGRFDRLWERARSRYRIVGEKTAAYLDWRYSEFTTNRHYFFCLIEAATRELAGYVVYTIGNNLPGGENKAFVRDLFALDLDHTTDALLLAFARWLRRDGRASISLNYIGPISFGERLKVLGFMPRPGARSLVAYLDPAAPEDLKTAVLDKESWFMIDGELDI